MFRLTDQQSSDFADAVRLASQREDWAGPLAAIYESVGDAVELYRPTCTASGACCNFDEYGHSLFVTTIELAAFLSMVGQSAIKGDGACPYQIAGRCSVHLARPFGCRIFYCDPAATEWQTKLYAKLHRQLQTLHDRLAIPYFYIEWRQALRCMNLDFGVANASVVHR